MTKIWLNHWFSTAYNIINLIKENESDFYVIGSNESENAIYKKVCDEWYIEPVLSEEDYVEYCLRFCIEHDIDIFVPRRGMVAISRAKEMFAEICVKVMVDDYEKIKLLNNKAVAYDVFEKKEIGYIPEHCIVTNVKEFIEAYEYLADRYDKVCFKFVIDEGGKSYRLIDNDRYGYSALFKKSNSRITFDGVVNALSERDSFCPLMVMPYLPGDEVSVDCLKTNQGIILLPRIKNATRIERISYDKEIIHMCRDFYEKIGLEYPCNIQFKYLDNIPYFLEVNTRMSGGIQMACVASEINIPNLAINKMLGIEKPWVNKYEEMYVSHIELPVLV